MAWTKTKTSVVAGSAILLAVGTTVLLVHWVRAALAPDIRGPSTITHVDSQAGQTEAGQTEAGPAARSVVGIGVALRLDPQDRTIRIQSIIANSPAAAAGLTPGSIVQKINDVSTAGITLAECARLIRGAAGTTVRLELASPDDNQIRTVELTRRNVQF